jgi:hypothetical protein
VDLVEWEQFLIILNEKSPEVNMIPMGHSSDNAVESGCSAVCGVISDSSHNHKC